MHSVLPTLHDVRLTDSEWKGLREFTRRGADFALCGCLACGLLLVGNGVPGLIIAAACRACSLLSSSTSPLEVLLGTD